MFDSAKLADRIAEHRRRLKLTQEQLGGRIGVSPQAVSKWENADAVPDVALIPSLAEALGVSTDYLLGTTPEIDVKFMHPELAVGKTTMIFDQPPVQRADVPLPGDPRHTIRYVDARTYETKCSICYTSPIKMFIDEYALCKRCLDELVEEFKRRVAQKNQTQP